LAEFSVEQPDAMNISTGQTLTDAFAQLRGESVTAITLVEDYVQVEVAGGRMSILEPLRIQIQGRVIGSNDAAFADELRLCVGASIRSLQIDDHHAVIELSNGAELRFSISESANSRETFIYQNALGSTWVIGPN
jgi:hypothetical protein